MPTLEISTNVPKEKVTQQVLAEMTKTLSTTVGKSADYCIVRIAPDQLMMFGGSSAPCAAASLTCIGKLGVEENKAHSKAIFECVEKHLGVPNDRMYIEFRDLATSNVGYKGTTFNEILGR